MSESGPPPRPRARAAPRPARLTPPAPPAGSPSEGGGLQGKALSKHLRNGSRKKYGQPGLEPGRSGMTPLSIRPASPYVPPARESAIAARLGLIERDAYVNVCVYGCRDERFRSWRGYFLAIGSRTRRRGVQPSFFPASTAAPSLPYWCDSASKSGCGPSGGAWGSSCAGPAGRPGQSSRRQAPSLAAQSPYWRVSLVVQGACSSHNKARARLQ